MLLLVGALGMLPSQPRGSSRPPPPSLLKRPMVVVLGMPKSGTESISSFLECNGWHSAHWHCDSGYCGDCMLRWVADISGTNGTDAVNALKRQCGNFNAFAQVDYEPMGSCIFPQVSYLATLIRYLPDACFVLNTRPTSHWLASVSAWNNMMSRLTSYCPIYPRNEEGLGRWYDDIKFRASRALQKAKCSVEFDIEDNVGLTNHLDRFFKLNSSDSCLGVLSHQTKRAPWPDAPPSAPQPPPPLHHPPSRAVHGAEKPLPGKRQPELM